MRSNLIRSHRGRGQIFLIPQLKSKNMDSEGFPSLFLLSLSQFTKQPTVKTKQPILFSGLLLFHWVLQTGSGILIPPLYLTSTSTQQHLLNLSHIIYIILRNKLVCFLYFDFIDGFEFF